MLRGERCLTTPSAMRKGLRSIFQNASQSPPHRGGVAARSADGVVRNAVCLLILLFLVTPLFAHHSTARYDLTKTVVVQGTVTEVIWQNPHVILVMNDTKGKEQAFEAPSPTYIVTSGWMKDTIKPGDKVTVKGNPARNGELPMFLVTITMPNGKEFSPKNPQRP